jgi:hypothetical protein
MRSEVGVTPWYRFFMPYMNGEELKHCRMADEELGCAEVYETYEVDGRTKRRMETRMLFGQVELKPIAPEGERIKAEPERAQEIWGEYQAEMRAKYGD